PFHQAFRNELARGFAPRCMQRYVGDIERIVCELIDAMLAGDEGCGDFHDLFAFPLPARMMCLMLGAPEAKFRDYKRWADSLQHLLFTDPEPGSYEPLLQEIYPHFAGLIAERVAALAAAGIDNPRPEHLGEIIPDDFMSRALTVRVEGRPLTPD